MEHWVTTWVRDEQMSDSGTITLERLYARRRWTSLRAWSEAVLALAAQAEGASVHPSLEMRTSGLPARVGEDPGGVPVVGTPVHLLVDASLCGAGRDEELSPMLSWPAWNELKVHLGEYGVSEEMVSEAISPTSFDEAHMLVDVEAVQHYVRENLDRKLIDMIIEYFSVPMRAYLKTWRPLVDIHAGESMQTVNIWVPSTAVLSIGQA